MCACTYCQSAHSCGCICKTCGSPVKDCCWQHPEMLCVINPASEGIGQHCKGYRHRKEADQNDA